jgi:replication-associated recombination protein RarA
MIITTVNGYGFFEASSAVQKAIRRGDEPTAMYFAVELFNSGYDEYLWKRMKIIASEDVGLANNNTAAVVHALYTSYKELQKDGKDGKPERVFFTHAVLMLVKAPKSRYVDLRQIAAWRAHDKTKMIIPDYAYDKHTLTGKRMGRGLDHFYSEGTHCENFHPQPGELALVDIVKQLVAENPGKLSFKGIKKGSITQQKISFDEQE